MSGRRRLAVGGLVLLLVMALVGVFAVHSMLSPERFTRLLRDQARAVGLEMRLGVPARATLWPHLAVQLRGLRLIRDGHASAMLSAREVLLVVPWSSLLQGQAKMESLRVYDPRIDVAQIKPWLSSLDAGGEPGTPYLPAIGAGIEVAGGTVVSGNDLWLKSLRLTTGKLEPGQPFRLSMQALTADDQALVLELDATPGEEKDMVRLDPLQLHLAAGKSPALHLTGSLQWQGGLRVRGRMHGRLEAGEARYVTTIEWADPAAGSSTGPLNISLVGERGRVTMALDPADAVAWWQQFTSQPELALPPVYGMMHVDSLNLGGIHIGGLEIASTPPLPPDPDSAATPAVTASASEPAAAASTTP